MDNKNRPFSQAAFMAKNAIDLSDALELAKNAARAGGEIIRKRFGNISTIHWKRGVEAQTPADVETEQAITRLIAEHFPRHTIYGEELGTRTGASPYTWVIDPLDGTSNFVLDIPQFAVCISLKEYQRMLFTVIYQPIMDILYVAQKGQGAYINGEKIHARQQTPSLPKSTVCSILTYEIHGDDATYSVIDKLRRSTRRLLDTWAPSLDWCLLATGKIDALIYLSKQHMWIDPGMLAGAFFFLEAGGKTSDLCGNPVTDITQLKSVIAAFSPSMIQEVSQMVAQTPSHTELAQNPARNLPPGVHPISTGNYTPPHPFDAPL